MSVPNPVRHRSHPAVAPGKTTAKRRPSILTRSVAVILSAFVVENTAHAQTSTWNVNNSGNWSTAANWAGSVVANGADNTANFRFNITATRTITLDTAARTIGNLVFEDLTTASNDWVLASSVATNVLTLDVSTGMAGISVVNRPVTISTVLAGTDGINATSASGSTLTLSGANTFTGGLNLSAGAIVQLNNASAAGTTNTISYASGATGRLQINGGVALPAGVSFNIGAGVTGTAGRGIIEQAGTGLATINGPISITASVTNGGHFAGGTAIGNELVLNGLITASASVRVDQRAGRVIYRGGGSGYNSIGITGTAIVGANDGLSTASVPVIGWAGAGTLDIGAFNQSLAGVTFDAGGAGTVTGTTGTLTLNGTLSSSGNITHTLNGNLNLGGAARDFNISNGSNAVDLTAGATITNGTINKAGAGTLQLTGTSNLIGLNVNAGTLQLNGGAVNGGTVTVNSGTLGGSGTIGNGIDLTASGTLSPGTLSTAGTITTGTLNLAGGSTTALNVGTSSDLVAVSGPNGLTTNTGAILKVVSSNGPLGVGTTDLINYSGTIQGNGLAGISLAGVGHATASLIDTGTAIRLNVTQATDTVIWKGPTGIGGSGTWDTNPANEAWKFQTGGAATSYLDGDDVRFEDLVTPAATTVNLAATLTPSRVVVDNTTANSYTFTGAGITGTTGLTKNGTGTLVLANPNTFTGATVVNGGTLELDTDTGTLVDPFNPSAGTSGLSIASGAIFKITKDDGDFTFNRNISGSGTVIVDPKTTAAAAVRNIAITGDNSGFNGQWIFTATTGAGTNLGSYRTNPQLSTTSLGTAAIQVNPSAQVWLAGNQTFTNDLTIAGAGYSEAAGGTAIGPSLTATNGVYVGAGPALFSYGGIGALRIDGGATLSGNIVTNGNAKLGAHAATATLAGDISSTNSTDWLVLGGGSGAHTFIVTGNANPAKLLVNGGSGTSAVTQLLQIGNNGNTGSVTTPEIVLYGNSAALAAVRFSRADGYTLDPGQKILAAAGVTADLARTRVYVNTTGTGLTLNGATIDLSDGTNAGQLHIAGNDNTNGINGATLNINANSTVDVGNFFLGEANGFAGIVNQSGTSNVSFLGQMRIAHWPNNNSHYNISGGTLTAAGVPTQFPFQTAGTQETAGGIYLGIDGAGDLTQSGGTITTNFVVLDNRAESHAATLIPTGVDTYTQTGGTLVLANAHGIISRHLSTAVNLNGGTIQAAPGISPNLDTNRINVGPNGVTLDTNGANVFNLYGPISGSGTISLTGGGTLQTRDGTGATLNAAGGGMAGGTLGATALNIGASSTLTSNRAGAEVWTGAITGSGALRKEGAGILTVTNGSAFAGSTTVLGGRLVVLSNFGSPTITVGDGASLEGEPTVPTLNLGQTTGGNIFFNPNTAGALTATNLNVSGSSTVDFGTVPPGSGPFTALQYTTKTGAGTISLANASTYRNPPTVTDTGSSITVAVSGLKSLTWTGTVGSTWDSGATANQNWNDGVGADNFFTGDTVTFGDGPTTVAVTVASGVRPWRTTVNSNTAAYTLTSSGSGITGPGGLEKFGTSTLTLVGANTYSGETLLVGGTLSIASSSSLGNEAVTNGIHFDGGKLTATASLDLGFTRSVTVGPGGATLSAAGGSALTIGIPGSLSGDGPVTLTSGATTAPTYILSGDNSAFSGNVTVNSTGATTGATTLRLASNNALTAGTLTLAQSTVGGQSTTLDLAGGIAISGVTLSMNSNATSNFRSQVTASSGNGTWNGPVEMNGDGLNQFSSATLITLNGNTTAGGGGFTGTMFLRGAGNGIINGTINLPAAIVNKTDGGTWTINSTGNTWASSAVSVGTVRLGAANALATNAPLTMGQNDTNTAVLDLNGFSQTVASLASNPTTVGANTTGKSITSATNATLTLNQSSNTIYASLITGLVSLVKNGTGSLTLSGANTFNGNVTVNDGTLVAGGATVTSLGNPTVGGRVVTVNAPGALNFTTNNVFGSGINNNNLPAVVLNGSTLSSTRYNVLGNVTLNGATLTQTTSDTGAYEGFQFRGDVSVTGSAVSTIATTNGRADHLGPNTVFDVGNVTANDNADLVISAPLRDQSGDFGQAAGGLTKNGVGTLEIASISTYIGATVVNAGILEVSGSILGSAVTVNSGAAISGGGAIGSLTVAGGFVLPGDSPGTLTTGAVAFDSATTLVFELAQPEVIGSGVNDLLSITGNFTLDGSLSVIDLPGFGNGSYRIANYSGALTNNGLDIDPAFLTAYPGSFVDLGTPNEVNLVVVPEPASATILLSGLGLVLGGRRLRRNRTA